jgi:hypothetical protein
LLSWPNSWAVFTSLSAPSFRIFEKAFSRAISPLCCRALSNRPQDAITPVPLSSQCNRWALAHIEQVRMCKHKGHALAPHVAWDASPPYLTKGP